MARRLHSNPSVAWLLFGAVLAWRWQTDLFKGVPAYGDVLEVVWGMEWYANALRQGQSPWFTPAFFHPYGWYVSSFGYGPFVFLVTVPLYWVGGPAFAFNVAVLLALGVAFAGSLQLARLFTPPWVAVVAALILTFTPMRWLRIGGHINILWLSSLLPWLLWGLERLRHQPPDTASRGWLAFTGLVWGVMLNASLYGIFLGALPFVLWGRALFTWARLRQALSMAVIALIVGAPAIALYVHGSQRNGFPPSSLRMVQEWGASLNSLFIPSPIHPLMPIQQFAMAAYSGPLNEAGSENLGLVTLGLGLLGLAHPKTRTAYRGLAWLTLTGLVLSLGVLLRWDGGAVALPFIAPLNSWVWDLGHLVKPAIFDSPTPYPPFDTGVPLPGLLMTALIPFWEAARVMARYALVGGLGLIILAAIGLARLPRPMQALLTLLWLLETYPPSIPNHPLPVSPHPAYAWIAQQAILPDEGILELARPSVIMNGGEVAYASRFTHKPTAAGLGSFWPPHTWRLVGLLQPPQALADIHTALILRQYRIRYLVFHMQAVADQAAWETARRNPLLKRIDCFKPGEPDSPWPFPICVAEVITPPTHVNVLRDRGWSYSEEWGIWAEGTTTTAAWIAATAVPHRLMLDVTPHCREEVWQTISIHVNGRLLTDYAWTDCDPWRPALTIPASMVHVGRNEIIFQYGYASRPVDVTEGKSIDARSLSVAFRELTVQPINE